MSSHVSNTMSTNQNNTNERMVKGGRAYRKGQLILVSKYCQSFQTPLYPLPHLPSHRDVLLEAPDLFLNDI